MGVPAQLDPDRPAFPLTTNKIVCHRLTLASRSPSNRLFDEMFLLWEQKRLFAGAVLLGIVLSLIVALLIPRTYESSTELIANDSSLYASFVSGLRNPALLIGVLGSDTVRNRLVERFDLRHIYLVDTYREAREKLESRTDLSLQTSSGIVKIRVTDRDPRRARDLTRAYVEELDCRIAAVNSLAAKNMGLFLRERIKLAHKDLDTSSQLLGQFSSENAAVALETQVSASMGTITNLQKQQIDKQSELAALKQIYGSQHINVRALQAQLAQMQSNMLQMAGPRTGQPPAFRPAYQLLPSFKELPLLARTYADLYHPVVADEDLLSSLVVESELVKLIELNDISNLQVIELAQIPEKSSGPPRFLIFIIGLVMSLLCARIAAGRFAGPRFLP